MRHGFVVGLIVLGCACGNEAPRGPSDAFEVVPPAAVVPPRGEQQFKISPSDAAVRVSWSVLEPSGGNVTAAGLYTAPGVPGVFHVVATSAAVPTVSTSATVTVDSGVSITATSPVEIPACDPVQLTATVSGSANRGVTWSTPADCGTVSAAGVFTSLRGIGDCLVTATAAADTTKTAVVTVNVREERVLSIALAPVSPILALFGTQQFRADVTTSCGTFPAQ